MTLTRNWLRLRARLALLELGFTVIETFTLPSLRRGPFPFLFSWEPPSAVASSIKCHNSDPVESPPEGAGKTNQAMFQLRTTVHPSTPRSPGLRAEEPKGSLDDLVNHVVFLPCL